MEEDVFWNYSKTSVTIKMANHGTHHLPLDEATALQISPSMDQSDLTDCVHAPGAFIDLLSIAFMLKTG
jgi:hypothetical protein